MFNPGSWEAATWLGLGTLATASIAAGVSVLNYVNFGKTKVADFRIKWIDEFRQEMAELYSLNYEIQLFNESIRNAKYEGDASNLRDKRRLTLVKLAMLRRRILLRLKPDSDDPDEQELERLLRLPGISKSGNPAIHRQAMIDLTRRILKREWNRIKKEIKVDNRYRGR